MRLFALRLLCAAFLVGVGAAPTSATPITSLPNGSIVPMPALNVFGAGPQVFSGITWTSSTSVSVFGWTQNYGFGGNGSWNGLSMAGSNVGDLLSTMTFTFATPVIGVGGFLNFAPGSATPVIAIYDSANNLLDSTVLSFLTGGGTNTGEFHGFLMNSAVISSFTLTGAFIGITDLTVDTTSAVPEPGTLLLLGAGMSLIAARLRKRT